MGLALPARLFRHMCPTCQQRWCAATFSATLLPNKTDLPLLKILNFSSFFRIFRVWPSHFLREFFVICVLPASGAGALQRFLPPCRQIKSTFLYKKFSFFLPSSGFLESSSRTSCENFSTFVSFLPAALVRCNVFCHPAAK